MGFDCWSDKIKLFEGLVAFELYFVQHFIGSDNGIWNKISVHVDFIHKTMRDLKEKTCKKH